MSTWQIILLCVLVAVVAAVIAAVRTRRKDIKKVAYMMDALEDGDIQYTSFVRLVETREQFLLFRGEYQANILPLAGFVKGAPEDFRTFIQEKTGRTFERVEA